MLEYIYLISCILKKRNTFNIKVLSYLESKSKDLDSFILSTYQTVFLQV